MSQELTNLDDFKEWSLETAGAELHSFLQRCVFLFENPRGGSKQPQIFSESHARIVSLLTGAVLDILRTNSSSRSMRVVQSDCLDDSSVTLTLAIAAFEDRGSAGFSLLKRASQFCEVRHHKDFVQIVAQITGWSLRTLFDEGLPELSTG